MKAAVGTQPYVWRPVEAVSHVLPTSGGCWRSRRGHSALRLAASGGRRGRLALCLAASEGRRGHSALRLAASGGRQPCPAHIWRLLEKPSWALSPTSGGQWRPSAMSCPHLAAAGEAVVGTQPYVWRPVEAVSHVLPTSGGCWRSRRGHSALRLAASGGRQR